MASRDLNPLEIIIHEKPLACAPADDSGHGSLDDIPMCLGCCARMSGNPKSTCSKCNWPVCSAACEQVQAFITIFRAVVYNLPQLIMALTLTFISKKEVENTI